MHHLKIALMCLLAASCGTNSTRHDNSNNNPPPQSSDAPPKAQEEIPTASGTRQITQAFVLFDTKASASRDLWLLFKSSAPDDGKIEFLNLNGPTFIIKSDWSRHTLNADFIANNVSLDLSAPTAMEPLADLYAKFAGGTVFHFRGISQSLCDQRPYHFEAIIKPTGDESQVIATITFKATYGADGRCKLLQASTDLLTTR